MLMELGYLHDPFVEGKFPTRPSDTPLVHNIMDSIDQLGFQNTAPSWKHGIQTC